MRKIVIFDLDDTLAPEDAFIRSGYKAVAEYLTDKYELAEAINDTKEAVAGRIAVRLYDLYKENSSMVFNRLLKDLILDADSEDIRELVKLYREHEIDPDIYDYYKDVKKALTELKNMGCQLGIISDGFKVSQRNKIKALKADRMFDKIILTDELGREYWKPDERAFVMMKEALGGDYSDMIYIGDNPQKDFYIGLENDIVTVRITREASVYRDESYLGNVKEKVKIESFEELPKLIKRV